MPALYLGLMAICGLGVVACLGAMYVIVRTTPEQGADAEA